MNHDTENGKKNIFTKIAAVFPNSPTVYLIALVVVIAVASVFVVKLNSKIDKLEKDAAALSQERDDLENNINDLNSEIKDKEDSSNQQIENLEDELDHVEAEKEQESQEKEQLQEEIDNLKDFISDYITNSLYAQYASRSSGIATEGQAEWLTASQEIKELKEYVSEICDDQEQVDQLIASIDDQAAQLQDSYDRIPNFRPAAGKTISKYGWRKHPILGYTKFHYGVDLSKQDGLAIYAAGKGTVTMVQWNDSYGWFIEIDHGNGYKTRYAHLKSSKTCLVSVGDQVEKGQHIATMGTTGLSTGVHLHFEVHHAGERIDPADFIGTY